MPASTTAQPELTREQVQAILLQPLLAASIFLASGVRIFDVTAAGVVRIPKLVSMDAPSWVGENGLIPEAEADFGEVTLLPDGLKSAKVITRFSNELARSSVVALDSALRDRMVNDVAAKLDHAFIAGTGDVVGGARTTPLGLLNQPGTQAMPAVGALSLDDLHDALGLALAANIDPSRLRWMLTGATLVGLRKLKDGDGRYLIQPDPTQESAYRLLGHGVTVTNRIPSTLGAGSNETAVVLWDPSTYAVARDMAPSVTILRERYAEYDQQAIRVVARADAAPLNPLGVVVLRGVTGVGA